MNNPNFILSLGFAFLTAAFFSLSAPAHGDSGAVLNTVRQYRSHGDWKAISKLLDSEVQLYKTSPTFANYSDICGIARALSGGISTDSAEPYWLFRRATWEALILPLPVFKEPEQVRSVFDTHHYLLLEVMYTTEPSGQDKVYDVNRRHDAAMLLLAYVNSLKKQIIPNYQPKPVAPCNVNLADRLATKQNFIDNSVQEAVQTVPGYIAGAFVNQIYFSYGQKPKNYDEAKALVDGLGMIDIEKKFVLRAAK
jgi:hypothetical protein